MGLEIYIHVEPFKVFSPLKHLDRMLNTVKFHNELLAFPINKY